MINRYWLNLFWNFQILVIFFVVILTSWISLIILTDPISDKMQIVEDLEKYRNVDSKETDLISRKWMVYAMSIAKKNNYDPPVASRFYTYIASIYADTLDKTGNSEQASLAVYFLLKYIDPLSSQEHKQTLNGIAKNAPVTEWYETAKLHKFYMERIANDNYFLSSNSLYTIKEGRKNLDLDNWIPWILEKSYQGDISPPPKYGSISDLLEIQKILYVTNRSSSDQKKAAQFWFGSLAIPGMNKKEYISHSGVWQNILFVEAANSLNDTQYAQIQKLLSQIIDDSYTYSLKIKFTYNTMRPSMRIMELPRLFSDSVYPGYVSELAAISESSKILLSYYFPNKYTLWKRLSQSAKNSGFIAGINFDIDNINGAELGKSIGNNLVQKLSNKRSKKDIESDISLSLPMFAIHHLYVIKLIENIQNYISIALQRFRYSHIAFNDVSESIGPKLSGSSYAVFADMNNDGAIDLITNDSIYFQKENIFGDAYSLKKFTRKVPISSVAIADYDNDGCKDIYLVASNGPDLRSQSDILLRNTCSESFVDVSLSSGISDVDAGTAASWADYNNDGFLDVYVSNWLYQGNSINPVVQNNILYKNNRNGTFTNVAREANVLGLPDCPNYPKTQYKESNYKNSYQPIWFDYNNDGFQDLFVATDSWISPLYKNNGNGTFSDVTSESGLCVPGTGMGVSVSDYDNDGDFDLYVTNTGNNYFWQNNGDGTFTEIAEKLGVNNKGQGWGTGILDFDNDMDDDIFVVNGAHDDTIFNSSEVDLSNLDELYENIGQNKFLPSAAQSGINGKWIKDSAAFGDYNNDGYIDVYVTARQHKPGVFNSLYKNRGGIFHSLRLKLIGIKSNRDAIGAVIQVKIGNSLRKFLIINGSSFRSQYSMPLIIGTGMHKVIDEIEISWPSGIVQKIVKLNTDRLITITERTE